MISCLFTAVASACRTARSLSAGCPSHTPVSSASAVSGSSCGQFSSLVMLKNTSRRVPPAADVRDVDGHVLGVLERADTAVAGNSVMASTSPVVSAVTRASAFEMVWKMTPSTFGGVFQWSSLAASSTNSPWLASTSAERPGADHLGVLEGDRVGLRLPDVLGQDVDEGHVRFERRLSGSSVVRTTVRSSVASISTNGAAYEGRNGKSSVSRYSWIVNATSSAVSGSPSWKVAPSTIVIVQVRPSSDTSHDSASSGTYSPAEVTRDRRVVHELVHRVRLGQHAVAGIEAVGIAADADADGAPRRRSAARGFAGRRALSRPVGRSRRLVGAARRQRKGEDEQDRGESSHRWYLRRVAMARYCPGRDGRIDAGGWHIPRNPVNDSAPCGGIRHHARGILRR